MAHGAKEAVVVVHEVARRREHASLGALWILVEGRLDRFVPATRKADVEPIDQGRQSVHALGVVVSDKGVHGGLEGGDLAGDVKVLKDRLDGHREAHFR